MHVFLANLMVGLPFVYALFGCCWHHGHVWTVCVQPSCGVETVTPCSGHCHAGKHQTDGGNRQHDQDPSPNRSPVEKYPCVSAFRSVGRTPAESLLVDAPLDLGAYYLLPAPVSPYGFTRTRNGVIGPLEWQRAARLHLVHQVLLI
jgi:hypothetical protein